MGRLPPAKIHHQIYGVGGRAFRDDWESHGSPAGSLPPLARMLPDSWVNERFVLHGIWRGTPSRRLSQATVNTYEISGVVKDTKSTTIGEVDEPIAYLFLEQDMGAAAPFMGFSLVVRYEGNPAELAGALHREIHAVDTAHYDLY